MNKQNLWFITLFSIILVLSIYYISMPSNILEEYNLPTTSANDTTINATITNATYLVKTSGIDSEDLI